MSVVGGDVDDIAVVDVAIRVYLKVGRSDPSQCARSRVDSELGCVGTAGDRERNGVVVGIGGHHRRN